MANVATTRMSSKGQVVIPEEIRTRLGLCAGTQFVVVASGDGILLRAISPPSMADFDRLVASARQAARRAGMRKSDIAQAIRKVRQRRAAKRSST